MRAAPSHIMPRQTLKKGTKVTVMRSHLINGVVAKTTAYNEEFPFVLIHTEHDTALLVRWDEISRREHES